MIDPTFAIVGTAGRNDDGNRLSKNHFDAMCECARLLLKQFKESGYGVTKLVSGGAAWADHVAVKLFLNKEVPKLRLCLPCPYNTEARQFDTIYIHQKENEVDNAQIGRDRRTYGEIVNGYHLKFTRKVGFNSLADIFFTIQQGAEIQVYNGFKQRNVYVAQSDIILAMTFGDHEWVKDKGGTAHAVQVYLNRVRKYGFFDKSFHYDLNSGEIFCGARVKGEDAEM